MKSKFIKRNTSERLILIFAGWGMDWRPFAMLDHPGYDLLVIWDYRELSFNWKPFFRYDEICLIAWSTGVFAASVTIHEIEPRITLRIAVNGTLTPIDELHGIRPSLWRGLQNTLSPGTLKKYQRRICNSQKQYEFLKENSPRRTIADLKEELEAFETHTIFHVEQMNRWDMAIVGQHDAIFPFPNQLEAWKGVAPVRMFDSGHFPDLRQLLTRLIIDKDLVSRRFTDAYKSGRGDSRLSELIGSELMNYFRNSFDEENIVGNVIEVGCGARGVLTRMWYPHTDRRAKLLLWDIAEVETAGFAPSGVFERCDAETRIRRQQPESARFIFSSSAIEWFNSPKEFLKECCRVLVPGGYLVVSSFIAGSLEELVSVTGKGLQMHTLRGWQKSIPAEMEILVCETEKITLSFDEPRQVLEYLRDAGVNAVRFGQSGAALARKLLREYPVDGDSGNYRLTFCPVYIVARKNGDD